LYNLDNNQQTELRNNIQTYKHFINEQQVYDSFDNVIEFIHTDASIDVAYNCTKTVTDYTFFLSPWHTDNVFHLHNDNLLPLFANLRSSRVLHASTKKRLYLYDGDSNSRAHTKNFFEIIPLLMGGSHNVYDFKDLKGTERICFEKIRWGRGPLQFYLDPLNINAFDKSEDYTIMHTTAFKRIISTDTCRININSRECNYIDWSGTAIAFARHITTLYHLQMPVRYSRRTSSATLLYIKRSRHGGRFMTNFQSLLSRLKQVGFETQECCEWNQLSVKDMIMKLQNTNILISLHGASLTNMIYMPPGSIVIELQTKYGEDVPMYKYMAHQYNHTYMLIDIRMFHNSSNNNQGYTVSDEWIQSVANNIKNINT
jgi:hypothetical protein